MIKAKKNNRLAFTLTEIIIVVLVIAILLGTAMVAYSGIREDARDSERRAELEILASAIDMYYSKNGHYPMSSGWCTQISNTVNGYDAAFAGELAPYLEAVPSDPEFKGTHQGYFYRNVDDTSYYLYAELETDERADDGFSGCERVGGSNNEYDYRMPAF